MAKIDSIDKIVKSYFACVTNERFTYKGESYEPRALRVSPMLFRGYTCPEFCAACCTRFSLDYLPTERLPKLNLTERTIDFNAGRNEEVRILSDMQDDHDDHFCRNVNKKTGRCGIHGRHPFSCDFELIRFMIAGNNAKGQSEGLIQNEATRNAMTQKLYGRGWNMLRIDDERGARCEMTEVTEETKAEVERKLQRLVGWLEHFGIKKHKVHAILEWAEDKGPRGDPLYLS